MLQATPLRRGPNDSWVRLGLEDDEEVSKKVKIRLYDTARTEQQQVRLDEQRPC
jgi:hypothetical protein